MFNSSIFPFRLPETPKNPEPIIQILPSKEMASSFSGGAGVDEIEYTDGEVIDWLVMRFKEDYFVIKEIIRCESRWQTDIVSPTGDVGLTQINLKAHWEEIPGETREEKIAWLQNPYHNIDFAYSLYRVKKWEDWYKSEWCWRPKFNLL